MASKVWLDVATSRRVADAITHAINFDKELRRMITAEVRKAAQQAA